MNVDLKFRLNNLIDSKLFKLKNSKKSSISELKSKVDIKTYYFESKNKLICKNIYIDIYNITMSILDLENNESDLIKLRHSGGGLVIVSENGKLSNEESNILKRLKVIK